MTPVAPARKILIVAFLANRYFDALRAGRRLPEREEAGRLIVSGINTLARLAAKSRLESGFCRTTSASPCVVPRYPLISTTGMEPRMPRTSRISAEPDISGMRSSVISASKRCGSARNAASAAVLEVNADRRVAEILEHARGKLHQRLLVIDDQHALACAARQR